MGEKGPSNPFDRESLNFPSDTKSDKKRVKGDKAQVGALVTRQSHWFATKKDRTTLKFSPLDLVWGRGQNRKGISTQKRRKDPREESKQEKRRETRDILYKCKPRMFLGALDAELRALEET